MEAWRPTPAAKAGFERFLAAQHVRDAVAAVAPLIGEVVYEQRKVQYDQTSGKPYPTEEWVLVSESWSGDLTQGWSEFKSDTVRSIMKELAPGEVGCTECSGVMVIVTHVPERRERDGDTPAFLRFRIAKKL